MDTLCAVLMGWAVTLSPYPAPADCPEIQFVDREELQRLACDGGNCRVAGFVTYKNPATVYAWDQMDMGNPLARSIIVHEMVHILQLEHGSLHADSSCEDKIQAEREAYMVQDQYLMQYGRIRETASPAECH